MQVGFLAISETKRDNSVPTAQFHFQGFSTIDKKDITKRNGGLLVYIEIFHQEWYLSMNILKNPNRTSGISENKNG